MSEYLEVQKQLYNNNKDVQTQAKKKKKKEEETGMSETLTRCCRSLLCCKVSVQVQSPLFDIVMRRFSSCAERRRPLRSALLVAAYLGGNSEKYTPPWP